MKCKFIYTVPVLLVLITPFIWSDNLYNGLTTAKQIWFYGAMALLILVTAVDLLFRKETVSFSFNIIDLSLLTFFVYFLFRTIFTPYTPLLFNARFLNYFLLLIFYYIVTYTNQNDITNKYVDSSLSGNESEKAKVISSSEILVVILILTGLIQAVWGLLQLYGITRSFHSGFKITGTFFNPAPYALYLAAVFPLALGTLLGSKELRNEKIKELKNEKIKELIYFGKPRLSSHISQFLHSLIFNSLIHKLTYSISLLTVVSIILVLPATMNRASWLGVAAGSLFVFTYRYDLLNRAKGYLYNTARKLFAITFVILVIGMSGAGLFLLKKGSSVGRLLIWEVTLGKTAEKPLFGHGVGRFEAEFNNWQADYFKSHPTEMDGPKGMAAGNTKYCFNEYLEMASELGIIGLLLFLAVITSVFLGIKDRNKELRNEKIKELNYNNNSLIPSFLNSLIIPISSLISLIVMALISFPFYSLPTLIVFFFLAALISSNIKGIKVSERLINTVILRRHNRLSAWLIYIASSSLVVISVLFCFMVRQQYKAYSVYDEAVMLYQTGIYDEACKSFAGIYKPLSYNGAYLQYYGKALNLNKDYPNSLKMLERARHFTSDEVLYTTFGDTYKALKRYTEAEQAYLFASAMVPHKLYPLYLLVLLSDETGEKGKAFTLAKRILNKEIKIESNATDEIRAAMMEIIRKQEKK